MSELLRAFAKRTPQVLAQNEILWWCSLWVNGGGGYAGWMGVDVSGLLEQLALHPVHSKRPLSHRVSRSVKT